MKKSIIKYILPAVLAAPVLTACEMDQVSPNNLTPEDATTSMQDAESWRMGLYSTMRAAYTPGVLLTSDLQLDHFVLTTGDGNTNGSTARWTFQNAVQDNQNAMWANNYSVIMEANKVLEYMKDLPNNVEFSADDVVEWEQIKGEAYLARAIAYQMLTTYYTDNYAADGADPKEQLGLVIYDKVDIESLPPRQSLDSTYNFMIADVDSAIRFMSDADPSAYLHNPDLGNNLMPAAVAQLLKARILLNKGDYTNAAAIAKQLVDDTQATYPLITTTEGLQSMWLNDEGSEIMFQLYQSKEELAASWASFTTYNVSLSGQLGIPAYTPAIQPSTEALAYFNDTKDIRENATFALLWSYYAYTAGSNGSVRLFYKYPGNPELRTAVTDCYNNVKLFRIPEAYLIAAEAEHRLGHTDVAFDYYNRLHHDARGCSRLNSSYMNMMGTDFLTELGNEYTREYIGEGLAFSVYKRLGRNVIRSASQQAGAVASYAAISVTPDNAELWKRWTWEVPEQDLYANRNIEKNW